MLWCVVPLEPTGDAPGFVRREGPIKRGGGVSVQVILNQKDALGLGKMHVAQLFEHMGVVDRRTARADRDMTPTFQGGEQHEQRGGAVPLVFIIPAGRTPWRH